MRNKEFEPGIIFTGLLSIILLIFTSCGGFKDYPAAHFDQVDFLKRAETKTENGITVTIAVLTSEEGRQLFGVDLFKKGVQPVWVEITNNTEHDFLFLPISLDPNYFAPNEVAFLYQGLFNGGKVHPELSERFNNYGYELSSVAPGETNKGFIYTNFDPGIKHVNITLFSDDVIETFVFYLVLYEEGEEYQSVDFETIYSESEYRNIDTLDALRDEIQSLYCCIKSEQGEEAYPVNFVFIGDNEDIFGALVRRGWYVTEPYSERWERLNKKKYFSSPLFATSPMENLIFYGRNQDLSLQKTRRKYKGTVRQRNEIRLWLTPITYNGDSVWVGTTTRDVGTDVTKIKDFVTNKIDPDMNETRAYLAEDMILSQNVESIGWVKTHNVSSQDDPHFNHKSQEIWSNGMASVLFFDEVTKSVSDITFIEWEFPFPERAKELNLPLREK